MYFCVDKYQHVGVGKTIVDAWEMYEEENGGFAFSELKFYKANEIKVELVETTVVKKVPVASKTTAVKKGK